MRNVLCVILGGGRGNRLYPLTKDRSKPAVPFAGRYRLIDIPISNCLHAQMDQIYILTQFNSRSLNRHISRAYTYPSYRQGFVEVIAAEQSVENSAWFQGTADAVRRCLKHFNNPGIEYIIILSGDQLYKMDLNDLLKTHLDHKAEITIACNTVPETDDISGFGIVGVDDRLRINRFLEKPQDKSLVKDFVVTMNNEKMFLASMGIYVFNKKALTDILINSDKDDFGKEIIPDAFPHKYTVAHVYKGYWRDVGSIASYYAENLTFAEPLPPLDLFNADWPFFTRSRYLPPSKFMDCAITRTMVSDGVIIDNGVRIHHSVIGLRSRIAEGVSIEDSIIIGNDYYETLAEQEENRSRHIPDVGIGKRSFIKRAIIDKNAKIGEEVKIINEKGLAHYDCEQFTIREGIVIIPKNAVIASHTII